MMLNKKTRFITEAGLIAAIYVVLTYLSSMLGMSSGVIQVRLSESLCILPYFMGSAVPGLFIGCFLANLLTGACALDLVFGSLATLIGAVVARIIVKIAGSKFKYIVPLPTILSNAIIVPIVLMMGYSVPLPYHYLFLTVGAGEVISVGIVGIVLMKALSKVPYFQTRLAETKEGES